MDDDSVEFEARQEHLETKSAGMSRNYFCVDCKCTTRNPRLYLEHRRDFHKEAMSIHACSFCVYASKHSQKLARHLRTVHRDVLQDISVQSTKSAVFNQMAEAIPDSGQTNQAAKNTRLSTCKLCGLYTVSKVMLMQHIRSAHTDVKIYECDHDHCDYTHYIRDRFNRHYRYHTMNKIKCKLCEFQTIYRWNLERHMRHHIDSVSLGFRCTKCNFTVSTKQSITAHEIAHHGGILGGDNIAIESVDAQMSEDPNASNKAEQEIEIEIESEIDGGKRENDCVSNNVGVEKQPMEGHNFDANAFLEVVMDDTTQPQPETIDTRFKDAMVKFKDNSSSSDPSLWRTARKTKHFFCINCSFRNEIDLSNWPDGIEDGATSFCAPPKIEPQSYLYRCGYCHQTSNWKHVIERHCRLVHNTSASIEKYSNLHDRFKPYTPIKRRTDFSTKTITMMKKKTTVESNTDEHICGHLFEK